MEPVATGKTIALIAHDNCKVDLLEWAEFNSTCSCSSGTPARRPVHEAALSPAV